MKIYGRNSKGKKVLITVPDWDDPVIFNEAIQPINNVANTVPMAVVGSNGAGGVNSSNSGSLS